MIATLQDFTLLGKIDPQKSTQGDSKFWGHLDDTDSFKGQRKTRGLLAAMGWEDRRVSCSPLAGWVESTRLQHSGQKEQCGQRQREESSVSRWLSKSRRILSGRMESLPLARLKLVLCVSLDMQQDKPLCFVSPGWPLHFVPHFSAKLQELYTHR